MRPRMRPRPRLLPAESALARACVSVYVCVRGVGGGGRLGSHAPAGLVAKASRRESAASA